MSLTRRVFLQALAASLFFRRSITSAATLQPYIVGKLPAPENIRRIVSAGAPADLLLLATAPEKLVGFSSFDFSHFPDAPLPAAVRQLPRLGRLAGRATTLPLEKLLSLNPDLIVDCGNADDTWISQARRIGSRTHIPWLLLNGTLKTTPQQLMAMGKIAGTQTRTQHQAELAHKFINYALNFAASAQSKLRFYAARGPAGLETGLAGSLHTEAAELLGLHNVAAIPGRNGLAQVSLENLLVWQPDIILVQEKETLHYLLQTPAWQGVTAVARRRILLLAGLPFGWLDAPPGINRLAGLRRLHAWLDPAVSASFKADFARYSTLFWHAPLDKAYYGRLMQSQ